MNYPLELSFKLLASASQIARMYESRVARTRKLPAMFRGPVSVGIFSIYPMMIRSVFCRVL
jgi:hypothetical protein